MPLRLHKTLPGGQEIGIWEITEPESWFRDSLLLYPAELRQLSELTVSGRRLEWLAARQLVHDMSGRSVRGAFVKDEYGKPHLAGTDWFISISHSHEWSAAIAGPRACGIDIQIIVPKITRLAHKFLNEAETNALQPDHQLEQLHLVWGAKEVLYKAYGRREIDWKAHLHIDLTEYRPGRGCIRGWLRKDEQEISYELHYRYWQGNKMLVYGWEVSGPSLPVVEHNGDPASLG